MLGPSNDSATLGAMDDHGREQPLPPRRVAVLPSYLVGQVAVRAGRLVGDALGEDGMRRHHFAVLASLDEHGPSSQAQLGRRLSIDRSDMHAVLRDLEDGNLVARGPDANDRRRNVVAITPAGTRMLARLDERVGEAQRRLLAPLSARERRELSTLLRRLVESG